MVVAAGARADAGRSLMDPIIGTIIAFGGNFAPAGWVLCDGQLLAIAKYQALHSLLGTLYGGDGTTNFAVPDLNGRMLMGSAPGGSYGIGQQGGAASVTLTTRHLPAHGHTLNGVDAVGTAALPGGNLPAGTTTGSPPTSRTYAPASAGPPVAMALEAISPTGDGEAVPTLPPFTCITYIIAWQGVYPSRP